MGRVCLADYLAHLNAVHIRVTRDCGDQSCLLLSSLLSGFPFLTTHPVQQAIDFCTSSWLNVLPLAYHHFDPSAQQFNDTLSLWYHHPLSLMLALCDGCGGDSVGLMHWIVVRVVCSLSTIMKSGMLWVTWLFWDTGKLFLNLLHVMGMRNL